jgi:hypothetical protein
MEKLHNQNMMILLEIFKNNLFNFDKDFEL